jgi:RNA polymerase sigma-70 factor (ECF subfamily)
VRLFGPKNAFQMIIFVLACNITVAGAIISLAMVGAMAKAIRQTDNDELVISARTDADALGQLYDLYYERIFRFCVHRLFSRETAEDVTSSVFLTVARTIRDFEGQTEADFRNWLYAIAANQTNAYIRKAARRRKLLADAALARASSGKTGDDSFEPDWPTLYQAMLKLKPEHQTIVTLRFFEGLDYEAIGQVLRMKPATIRVTLHRVLRNLRSHLQTLLEGE